MVRGIGDLAQALGVLLPPWAVGLILVGVLVAAAPAWMRNLKIKQIRGLARRLVRAEGTSRAQLVDELFALSGSDARLLAEVAEQAHRYGQIDTYRAAMDRLRPVGHPVDVKRLEQLTTRTTRATKHHPVEYVVTIGRMIDDGLLVAAEERLDEALSQHPGDDALLALKARLDAVRAAPAMASDGR